MVYSGFQERWRTVRRSFRIGLCGAFLFLVAGCETIEKRIAREAELFASFPPEIQERIRAGEVDLGFTPGMVRIAWGEPDVTETIRTTSGAGESWIYLDREQVYAGRRFAGYEPQVYFDPRTKSRYTFWEPVYVDVYHTVEHERNRVDFEEGRVVSVIVAE